MSKVSEIEHFIGIFSNFLRTGAYLCIVFTWYCMPIDCVVFEREIHVSVITDSGR